MWSEAMHAWKDGSRPWLPEGLVPTQREHNTQFRRDDEILENRLDGWLPTAPNSFEISQAADGCGLISGEEGAAKLSRRDEFRLGAALRNMGYEKKHERFGGRRAYVWRKT